MSDDVREIKSQIDIVDVIGDYVQLRKSGSSLVGLCPFHAEKTPSFHVSHERQTYHCFGCGKGGDVFSFIMEMEGISFRETLELLAGKTGVKLSSFSDEIKNRSVEKGRDIRSLLEESKNFFHSSLTGQGGEAARAYMARRNLDEGSWRRFELGWSPQSWDALSRHLQSCGFGVNEIIDSGMAIKGDRGLYDRFRGRVIFPVRDEMARITGFGGRLIDGEGAKYVNSPEGDYFNKRRLLYLMHEAKRAVRERGRVILMEGYMDAIRAHLSGFTEAVASLGTSLTEEQASLIKRFSDLCYIAYDADGAGQEASIRGMYILQRRGVDVRVVTLKEGLDPDDALSAEGGVEAFEHALKKSMPLPIYHVHIRRNDLRTPGKRRKAIEEVLAGLAVLPMLDIAEYIPSIAKGFGILQHELQREINARRKEADRRRISKNKENEKSAIYTEGIDDVHNVYIGIGKSEPDRRTVDLECAFCSLLWHDEELRSAYVCGELISLFADEATAGILSALLSGDTPQDLESRWRIMGESNCMGRIARGDAVLSAGSLGSEHAEKLLEDIRANAMRRKYDALRPIVLSEEACAEELMEYHELAKKLKGLKL
ncbi:MAG: DNA primase [Synergistaceae bacterium]|jgi:DNA primase|nr:DNA primase [Synergistaceae bacterium]